MFQRKPISPEMNRKRREIGPINNVNYDQFPEEKNDIPQTPKEYKTVKEGS